MASSLLAAEYLTIRLARRSSPDQPAAGARTQPTNTQPYHIVVLALGVALLALGSQLEAAPAGRTERGDSVRTARRVIIGDDGVRIIHDESEGPAATGRTKRRVAELIEVDGGGVRVHKDLEDSASDGSQVSVPGLVVDVGESGIVRLFADAEVPAGERVEGDVVAVFGSVLVEGEVTGDVVAVCGSVKLGPDAAVGRDVVAVGGALDQAPGATVSGQSVSLGFLPVHWGVPPLPLLLTTVLTCWLLSLFTGWILTLLFPTRMLRIAGTASTRALGSFVLGLLSAPLLVIAIVLLMVTVIGIPIAFLLPPIYLVALWAGQLAASYVLGCRLLRRRLGEGRPMAPMAAGTLFVALFFVLGTVLSGPPGLIRTFALFFTLLGVLLVLALCVIGIGAVLLSRVGSRPRELVFEPSDAPAVMPPSPTSASTAAPPVA